MVVFICLIFLFNSQIFPQKDSSKHAGIHSPSNIKRFADYLFCTDDYLRSAIEYEKYLNADYNDTVEFKTGLSYLYSGNYEKSLSWFEQIKSSSGYFKYARDEYFRSLFGLGDYHLFRNEYMNKPNNSRQTKKLFYFSYFLTDDKLPSQEDFLSPFNNKEEGIVKKFYLQKINPQYKSETISVLLSILVPGAGKIYTNQIGDGIFTAIATGLCGYLAYDNFKAKHNFRGWIFSGLSAFFYAGNIYGSAASAQIYNAGIRFDFSNDVKLYLQQQNYFTNEYDFCR
jgi:TM2 domain-containing membrane protein YozV